MTYTPEPRFNAGQTNHRTLKLASLASAALLFAASGSMLVGCDSDGGFEEAGENVDEAVEETGENIDEAVEETGDAMEETADDMEDEM